MSLKLRLLLASTLLLFGVQPCTSVPAPAVAAEPPGREYSGRDPVARSLSPAEQSRRDCETRLRSVLEEPAVPGAPGFEAHRGELLARAKAEPVLFRRAPEYVSEAESMSVDGFRKLLERTTSPWSTVERLLGVFKGRPQPARATLLREGYLYSEDPELAYALVGLVQPDDLFGHDEIWIQRGGETLHAERRKGKYYYKDGALANQRVRLLHLDRIGHGPPPAPLHIDLRTLRYQLHFDRMEVRHVTDTAMVANLRYGQWSVPSVLRLEDAHAELECEVLAPHLREPVQRAKQEAARRTQAVQALRAAMLEQVLEELPFDEPHHEYGHQLDGKLRKNWLAAYMMRRTTFAFNGDRYFVYDASGRPHVPQVCVDFLTDTLERTSGTWWSPRSQSPKRVVGKLDFYDQGLADRDALRQVPEFLSFARGKSDWFEVYDTPVSHHYFKMGYPDRFYPYLGEHADVYRPGDIVMIRGRTPWDRTKMHYHSFFVYESDPVTGMPLVVVGNAGTPSLRAWETEGRRTPRRSIYHRIRPKTEWLDEIRTIEPIEGPPPLAVGRD